MTFRRFRWALMAIGAGLLAISAGSFGVVSWRAVHRLEISPDIRNATDVTDVVLTRRLVQMQTVQLLSERDGVLPPIGGVSYASAGYAITSKREFYIFEKVRKAEGTGWASARPFLFRRGGTPALGEGLAEGAVLSLECVLGYLGCPSYGSGPESVTLLSRNGPVAVKPGYSLRFADGTARQVAEGDLDELGLEGFSGENVSHWVAFYSALEQYRPGELKEKWGTLLGHLRGAGAVAQMCVEPSAEDLTRCLERAGNGTLGLTVTHEVQVTNLTFVDWLLRTSRFKIYLQ